MLSAPLKGLGRSRVLFFARKEYRTQAGIPVHKIYLQRQFS
jgi:hypothetical protein